MRTQITVSTPIDESPRVMQVRGLFDLAEQKESSQSWMVELPLESRAWQIGLIVGPSGCGKSTIARKLWPQALAASQDIVWPKNQTILDAFPVSLSVKDVVSLLSSVGFSSPPAWLRPFHVLSTGQQFRVTLARLLAEAISRGHVGQGEPGTRIAFSTPGAQLQSRAETPPLIVFDEFTSVVDRTVAQVGSAALAKTVRERELQFIAVTCHEDVEPWLNPDWVYRPAEGKFLWRALRQRPAITLHIVRVAPSAWALFAPHHYLSESLNASACCFLGTWQGRPVVFSAWLPFVGGGPPRRREHRTVTLPDFQGVGLGHAISSTIAAMWRGLGFGAISTTTHPAFIASRRKSPLWRLTRAPSLAGRSEGKLKHATTRLTAGFEYIGPAMDWFEAKALHAT
jgi:energy-coupling factor transporter ATP-binding protein EcfA2